MPVRSLLITAPDDNLWEFHMPVCLVLNSIDRRGQTVRYSCMEDDLPMALEAAKKADVTVQEIVRVGTENPRAHDLGGGATVTVSDNVERYDVLHLGTHGMKWEAKAPKAR